ncbi:MAG: DUF366 family protein [bacterium]|nr:DUF366 family protein [bacterium]MBU1919092.1 DUF366 family protein [bacterium]
MKVYFSEDTLTYDGTQLRSHFAYDTFNVLGDSIVAFIGPCDVKKEHLVDLEDVHQNQFIYSENMLHFIVEHFNDDLNLMIAKQRLLISLIIQEMNDTVENLNVKRQGDDIYDDTLKLSVSIATSSPVSCLIHTGINISSKNTPVPAVGLDDYKINAHALATGVLNRYRAEMDSMEKARCKVKSAS